MTDGEHPDNRNKRGALTPTGGNASAATGPTPTPRAIISAVEASVKEEEDESTSPEGEEEAPVQGEEAEGDHFP